MHQLVVKKFSTLFDARCNHEVRQLFKPLKPKIPPNLNIYTTVCIFYGSQHEHRLFLYTAYSINLSGFIIETESVYCTVRTESSILPCFVKRARLRRGAKLSYANRIIQLTNLYLTTPCSKTTNISGVYPVSQRTRCMSEGDIFLLIL